MLIRRLRIKFICITMAIVTVMMTLLLVGQVNTTGESLFQRNVKALEDAAREYRQELPQMPPTDQSRGNEITKPDEPHFFRPDREKPCFLLWLDSEGDLSAQGSSDYDLTDRERLMEVYLLAADKEQTGGVLWNYELQFLRTDGPKGPVYAFTDASGELETIRQMVRNGVILWCLGFGGFLILSMFLANWAIRPVEQAWQQQRRFVADASHELKTPLTVILTNAQLLREQADTAEQRRCSDSIAAMASRMRTLVESMLQLARADSGQTAAEREKLDWSALLEQTVLPFEPLFFEAGLTLETSIRPGICLMGNAVQLRQAAEILLDNALKYSAPGGTVRVVLESHGGQCCLRVSSPGQTLTPEQCRDIFKRFYRVDPARRSGSYGLGLAIAERLVSDHRGRIRAEGKDGINTFYVNLPVI